MDELKRSYDLAIILISHDLEYVAKYADKVILLDATIVRQGSAAEVFGSPEFAAVFSTGNTRNQTGGGIRA
jgi:zinc transport system ATP-binding protein